MIIEKVTITGACETTNIEEIIDISKKYPYIEWAILISNSSTGYSPRFPSLRWLNNLSEAKLNNSNIQISAHLCGKMVKELFKGNDSYITNFIPFLNSCERIQINTHAEKHILLEEDKSDYLSLLDNLPKSIKEIIFQIDNVNNEIRQFTELYSHKIISGLFDLSHGTGISPNNWPILDTPYKRGYAGGLGPDNLKEELIKIDTSAKGNIIWIDMETKVRSNNDKILDLYKVIKCLEIAKEYTNF